MFSAINDNHSLKPNSYYLQQFQAHTIPTNNPRWGRLLCQWQEKRADGHILKHSYAARIDKREGGVYLDCLPQKIFAKTFAQLLGRPLFMVIKTIYHISMLEVIENVGMAWEGQQSASECLTNSLKNVADIIRTPIYGLAMIIASVAVLCLGLLSPESLYSGNVLIGKLEQMSNWGERHTFLTLGKCFQPFSWEVFENFKTKDCSYDTLYPSDDPVEHQLANFVRAQVRFRRKNGSCDMFECQFIDKKAAYISPFLDTPAQFSFLPMPVS